MRYEIREFIQRKCQAWRNSLNIKIHVISVFFLVIGVSVLCAYDKSGSMKQIMSHNFLKFIKNICVVCMLITATTIVINTQNIYELKENWKNSIVQKIYEFKVSWKDGNTRYDKAKKCFKLTCIIMLGCVGSLRTKSVQNSSIDQIIVIVSLVVVLMNITLGIYIVIIKIWRTFRVAKETTETTVTNIKEVIRESIEVIDAEEMAEFSDGHPLNSKDFDGINSYREIETYIEPENFIYSKIISEAYESSTSKEEDKEVFTVLLPEKKLPFYVYLSTFVYIVVFVLDSYNGIKHPNIIDLKYDFVKNDFIDNIFFLLMIFLPTKLIQALLETFFALVIIAPVVRMKNKSKFTLIAKGEDIHHE